MSKPDTSPFFSRNSPVSSERLLSSAGRSGRLSLIARQAFLNLIFFFSVLSLSLFAGIINLNTLALNNNFTDMLFGFTGFAYVFLLILYIWLSCTNLIRRLHDMNRSGWLLLLLLIPVLQILFMLYLLLFPGTKGQNLYGLPQTTALWEKVLAWMVILLTVLSLLTAGSLVSYMMGAGELQTPAEVIQNGTGYF